MSPSAPLLPAAPFWVMAVCAALAVILFAVRVVIGAPPGSRLATMPWRQILSGSLLGIVVLWFLWAIRDLLAPFVIAFFLASLLDPVVTNMQRQGAPRGRLVGLLFGGLFAIVLGLAVLVVPQAQSQFAELSDKGQIYLDETEKVINSWYMGHQRELEGIGIKSNPLDLSEGPFAEAYKSALENVKVSLGGLASKALWFVIIPISLYYFLLNYQAFRGKLISLVPKGQQTNVDLVSTEVVEIFSAYLRGLAKVCFIFGICSTLLFVLVFRLPYGMFLGMMAGILYAVPYAGPVITMLVSGIIALTVDPSAMNVAKVCGSYLVMNFIFDYGITPRVIGGGLGIHPVLNIFALMVGAKLFGVWGMLLAVPVAASVQMTLCYFYPRLTAPPAYDPMLPHSTLVDVAATAPDSVASPSPPIEV